MEVTAAIALLAGGKRLASNGQGYDKGDADKPEINTTFTVVMYLTAIVYTIMLLLGLLRLSPYLLRCK